MNKTPASKSFLHGDRGRGENPETLSVIVPTLNEEGMVAGAIESAWAAGATEVIVADGGSTDVTVAEAEAAGATVVHSPPGRGRQLRAGADAATGRLLLFLHADCRLTKDAGSALCQWMRTFRSVTDHDVGRNAPVGGGFRQRVDDPRRRFRWIERGNAWRADWLGLIYGDQAMWVTREAYDAAGGFPDWPLMEDVEFSRRLRRVGSTLLFPPQNNMVMRFLLRVAGHREAIDDLKQFDVRVIVDARRWNRTGTVRQTLLNWTLVTLYFFGVSPERLAKMYGAGR